MVEQVGQPAAAILDTARDGADLVVVGSRHRG
jgi:nucleotide-binding universal stress UspA family protein